MRKRRNQELARDSLWRFMQTHSIGDESSTSRGSSKTKEGRKTTELALGLTFLASLTTLSSLAEESRTERDGERGEEHERRQLLQLGVLGLVARHGGTSSVERVELAVRRRVEQEVLANAKHLDHLFVKSGHHVRFGGALAHTDETVNVLGGAERFLPQFEVDGRVELLETRVEVTLERVGVVQVDRVGLVRVLLRRREVRTERLRQATELCLALVREAERERLVRDGLPEDEKVSTRYIIELSVAAPCALRRNAPGKEPQDERCCEECRARCGRPPTRSATKA